LSAEEEKKVLLWAEATKKLALPEPDGTDFSFLLQVVQDNTTVPVILVDHKGEIVAWRNLDSLKVSREGYLEKELEVMKTQHDPIVIEIGGGEKNYIYYKNSILLTRLTLYPFIQLGVITLFILVSYIAFSASRKAEQNKVWVGLSKETAHQLGTPTSSLLAWAEILRERNVAPDIMDEMEKDIRRLEKITERFSKVGSEPVMKSVDLTELVVRTVDYIRTRVSGDVVLQADVPMYSLMAPASSSLLEWVLENVMKNAVDALEGGKGTVTVTLVRSGEKVIIDVIDTGKGIPRSLHKTIFKPGFTTKSRGWGLGLSLSKRIIEMYHKGRIFVAASEPGKGTTIRIILPGHYD
ncbi:MAG: ATP-binding protein, partial [Bacteroidales bacterium]|nr:ATP-binding protein [Bacteroidales bacterium]